VVVLVIMLPLISVGGGREWSVVTLVKREGEYLIQLLSLHFHFVLSLVSFTLAVSHLVFDTSP